MARVLSGDGVGGGLAKRVRRSLDTVGRSFVSTAGSLKEIRVLSVVFTFNNASSCRFAHEL